MMKDAYDNPGWHGYISTSKSEFDNRSMASLEPALLSDWSSILRLGLRWNTDLGADSFLLIAEIEGAENFAPKDTIDFNIDGKITSLKASDPNQYGITSKRIVMSSGPFQTPVELGMKTQKTYRVSRETVESIINAKKVIVRVSLLNSFLEQRIEPSSENISAYNQYPDIWAKGAFKKFLRITPIK
tara:strand:- start:5187 stop:5744 length:558 start_codon:yes stop_codon:yes gene_type:complete